MPSPPPHFCLSGCSLPAFVMAGSDDKHTEMEGVHGAGKVGTLYGVGVGAGVVLTAAEVICTPEVGFCTWK